MQASLTWLWFLGWPYWQSIILYKTPLHSVPDKLSCITNSTNQPHPSLRHYCFTEISWLWNWRHMVAPNNETVSPIVATRLMETVSQTHSRAVTILLFLPNIRQILEQLCQFMHPLVCLKDRVLVRFLWISLHWIFEPSCRSPKLQDLNQDKSQQVGESIHLLKSSS